MLDVHQVVEVGEREIHNDDHSTSRTHTTHCMYVTLTQSPHQLHTSKNLHLTISFKKNPNTVKTNLGQDLIKIV